VPGLSHSPPLACLPRTHSPAPADARLCSGPTHSSPACRVQGGAKEGKAFIEALMQWKAEEVLKDSGENKGEV